MAGKKKGEVEAIRSELQHLSEAVWALREHVTVQSAAAAAAASSPGASPAPPPAAIATDLVAEASGRGVVETRGVVRNAAGDREYRWDLKAPAAELLAIDEETASRILAAIGHRQRLAILKTILAAPATAADLVSGLDLGTTGAAYHHLNVLQAADLVMQEGRGVFAVRPHRVSALYAIFAGIESAMATSVTEASPAGTSPNGEVTEPAPGGKGKKKKAA